MKKLFYVIMVYAIILCGCGDTQTATVTTTSTDEVTTTTVTTTSTTKKETTSKTTTKETTTTTAEDSGDISDNKYFKRLFDAAYETIIDTCVCVELVEAKQDCTAKKEIVMKDSDGNVVFKKDDTIALTAGSRNYFSIVVPNDIPSDATVNVRYGFSEKNPFNGDICVEMSDYNCVGNRLYVTFKRIDGEFGALPYYKLICFKDGKLVDTADGFIETSELANVGDESIASVYLYNSEDVDTVVAYFE